MANARAREPPDEGEDIRLGGRDAPVGDGKGEELDAAGRTARGLIHKVQLGDLAAGRRGGDE